MPPREHYKDLQLPQLRSFCLAAARGNFTAAAETLDLSVSAVWQQVRALERQVGASLLRRRGRTVELTPEGRLLLELIQPHLSGLDSLSRLFNAHRQELPRQVSVAATEYLLSYNLAKTIEKFTVACPAVRLNLRADTPGTVMQWVEAGEADVGITPTTGTSHAARVLDYQDLFERVFMLVSSRHLLARKKQFSRAICRPSDDCAAARKLFATDVGTTPATSWTRRTRARSDGEPHGGRGVPLCRPGPGNRPALRRSGDLPVHAQSAAARSSIPNWKRFRSP